MKLLAVIFLMAYLSLSAEKQDKCKPFEHLYKKRVEKIKKIYHFHLSFGLRVNNLIVYSVSINENRSKRALSYKQFFLLDGVSYPFLFFKTIKPYHDTYFHHPRNHLLVFHKNIGYIQAGSFEEMDGALRPIPQDALVMPEVLTILYEILFLPTNHNFIGRNL